MKKILLAVMTIVGFTAYAQDVVCYTSSTEKFAFFASNKNFNNEHPLPRVYVHVSQAGGEMIKFKCADGTEANAYLLNAKKATNNWIFVFQEWWGLNDNIKRHSEDLYKDLGNVNVLALDMYDGKLATDRETAGKYMGEFKQDRGDIIVKGALAFAGPQATVGTLGWCFSGGQSILATLTAGKQAAGCVIYYGMPVEDMEKLKTLNCDVLGIFGTQDGWISGEVVKKFEVNMKSAGKKLIVKNYDANHGFANPSNPMGNYNQPAAADAYNNTVQFFKVKLK
jgi:carboxymethylenebutenolidase